MTDAVPARPRIVIVGGGFAGLYAAKRLAGAAADLTVIDRQNHHLFQPLLYQVATAALAPSDIASPIRAVFTNAANIRVVMGEVSGIDTASRRVCLLETEPVPYDTLILATGAATSWFGHQGWESNSFGLKSLDDALAMRRHVLGVFEWAESRTDPAEIARLLTFVVVGGGPTGVELAGSIAELARSTLARDYRHIKAANARVILCDAGDRLLASFPESLSGYAARRLEGLGVELRLKASVETVDEGGIVAAGERIASATVLWAAGVAASPAAGWLGVDPGKHGAIRVAPDLSVPGCPGVYAIGDVAFLQGPDGHPLPGLATVAKQQGQYVGGVILAGLSARAPPGPFRYRDVGSLAIIGRSAAVGVFGRVYLRGLIAWMLWGCVHLVTLMGGRNRVTVYVSWLWSWVTWGRGARLITGLVQRPPEGPRRP